MPRPKPEEPIVPVALRPPASLVERLDVYAARHSLSRHAAILALLGEALDHADEQVSKPARKLPGGGYMAPTGPASKPPAGGSAVRPPSAPKEEDQFLEARLAQTEASAGLQLGPAPSAPGSRLKKGKTK